MLFPGDVAPYFQARSTVNPRFTFDTAAGRYIVLSFFGSSQIPSSQQFLNEIVARGDRFDVSNVIFFGVTNDPQDVGRISHQDNGRVYFFDQDLSISRLYGLVSAPGPGEAPAGAADAVAFSRKTFVLDQALRVVAVIDMCDADVPRQIDE